MDVWQAKLNRPALLDQSITWKLAQAHFHWCVGALRVPVRGGMVCVRR
jgi:hypothetical protein